MHGMFCSILSLNARLQTVFRLGSFKIPEFLTIQRCGISEDRSLKLEKDEKIWLKLQRHLDENDMEVKNGVMQDKTFITSEPGHAPVDKPRGSKAKTRRNEDGNWVKKGGRSHFGYKLHVKTDIDMG